MEILEVALGDVVNAAAVGADDALGLVGCNQIQRAAAVGAVEAHGFDARGAAGLQTDVDSERLQRGLLAGEQQRGVFAVVDGGEAVVRPGEVGVFVFDVRLDAPGDLTFAGDDRGAAGLVDDEVAVGVPRIEGARGWQISGLGLERNVVPSLRLGDPAPAAVVERGVPLVPDAAHGVAHLRAAGEAEADLAVHAGEVAAQGGTGVDERADFADQLRRDVTAGDDRMAEIADDDNRRADLGIDRTAAGWTVDYQHAVTSSLTRSMLRTLTSVAPRISASRARHGHSGRGLQQ